jgi:hypothetical protein
MFKIINMGETFFCLGEQENSGVFESRLMFASNLEAGVSWFFSLLKFFK